MFVPFYGARSTPRSASSSQVCVSSRDSLCAGEGKGAMFTVRLPTMAVASVGDDGARAAGPRPRALAGIRVLLIEDEPDSRDLARAALARFGAMVSAASTSAEAVNVVLSATPETMPQVVVSDIGMPVEDGYVFIQQLRALSPERAAAYLRCR